MRAMVLDEWGGPMTLQERPDPQPDPGEAVMKVRAAGLGLTLAHMRRGVFGGSVPRIMGHELAGDIVAVGEGVDTLAVDNRVGVYFYVRESQAASVRTRLASGGFTIMELLDEDDDEPAAGES